MDKLTLREVTRDNWRDTLQLTVHADQQRFISDYVPIAAIALAKAYIRPRGLVWEPYAFCSPEAMLGFVALAYEAGSTWEYWLFHFFIDQHYQGQGYGKQALYLLLQHLKDQHDQCESVQLTVHPENERAQRLYKSAGFQFTGTNVEQESVYRLNLRS